MNTSEIKQYLEQELPDFTYISGEDTPHEENWNSIRVIRDDKEIILDVSKVDNKRGLENLKAYIESLWNHVDEAVKAGEKMMEDTNESS